MSLLLNGTPIMPLLCRNFRAVNLNAIATRDKEHNLLLGNSFARCYLPQLQRNLLHDNHVAIGVPLEVRASQTRSAFCSDVESGVNGALFLKSKAWGITPLSCKNKYIVSSLSPVPAADLIKPGEPLFIHWEPWALELLCIRPKVLEGPLSDLWVPIQEGQ